MERECTGSGSSARPNHSTGFYRQQFAPFFISGTSWVRLLRLQYLRIAAAIFLGDDPEVFKASKKALSSGLRGSNSADAADCSIETASPVLTHQYYNTLMP